MGVKKIVIVTADWERGSRYISEIAKIVGEKSGLPIDERKEDWDFLVTYGEKDEYGGVEVPQLFIECDDGKIVHVLTKVPLNESGKPDIDKGVEIVEDALSTAC